MTLQISICLLFGYLLGSLNPAALLDKIKHVNLRERGSGNLGATNTMIIMGRKYGTLVLLFDFFKGFFAVRIARTLFPGLALAGLLTGSSTVFGHVFPFYLKFKGGKGLAAYGGMLLALDPLLFLIVAVIALVLVLVFNYSVAAPLTGGILFPILYGLRMHSLRVFSISAVVGILVIAKHFGNLGKARRKEDITSREFIQKHLLEKEGDTAED